MDGTRQFFRHDLIPWFTEVVRSCVTIDHCNSAAMWIIDLKEKKILNEPEEEFWLAKIGQQTQAINQSIYEKIEKREKAQVGQDNDNKQ